MADRIRVEQETPNANHSNREKNHSSALCRVVAGEFRIAVISLGPFAVGDLSRTSVCLVGERKNLTMEKVMHEIRHSLLSGALAPILSRERTAHMVDRPRQGCVLFRQLHMRQATAGTGHTKQTTDSITDRPMVQEEAPHRHQMGRVIRIPLGN